MWTFASTLRLLLAQIAGNWCAVLLSAACLTGCGSGETPQQISAAHCLSIGGRHDESVSIVSPRAGTLRIGIEERGISIAATLDGNVGSTAESPVERLGTIVLVTATEAGQTHFVRVHLEDSPDVSGSVCVAAQLIAPSDRGRASAERAFSAAGRATHKHDWETAFDQYLSATRSFDRLHLPGSSALGLQAMAEIAYLRFDRKRDSYALASEALEGSDGSDPAILGALTGIQGKALLDMPGMDPAVVAPRIRELLAAARRYDRASRFGVREVPRLDIMTGFLEYTLDAPARAYEVFADAAQSCRALRDWDCYAIANQNLAELAAESNNYTAALSAYADALRVLPPELDPKLSADIWNNYARVQGIVGLFNSSERSHEIAMRKYARLGDCPGVRRSLSWSGNLMVQIGTLRDAEDSLEQAASQECPELLAANDPVGPATNVAAHTSQRSSAEQPGIRPESCAQPLDASSLAIDNKMIVFNALLSLGGAFVLEGESEIARRCVDAAERYAATARSQMRLANARGSMLLDSNDASGARAAFEQSLRIADDAKIPAMYENRGIARLGLLKSALLAGNSAQAVQDGLKALQSSVGRADIDQTVTSLRLLAAGFRGSERPAEAAHTLQVAADLIEGVPIDELDGEKRATYLATQHTVFAELTDLYTVQAATDNDIAWLAFATSERGRARSLRYAITQETRDASPLDAPPETRYQQLLREVVKLTNSRTDAPQRSLTDELDEVAQRERGAVEPFDRGQLIRTLKQLDATLVEYAVGARDMFAIVINQDAAHVVRLGGRREIATAAAQLYDSLRDTETPTSEVRAAAGRLARLALWPITERLTAKRIIFVPDDALHTVPFNALPWSSNPDDRMVLQHTEVSIVPSALFLTRIHTNSPSHTESPRIELLGDPVFRMPDWRRECANSAPTELGRRVVMRGATDWTEALPPLPGSRTEVQLIAKLARTSRPGSHIETLLGCSAVPSALRRAASERIDLLHIATHARVDAQRPRLSALALTPEGPGDKATSVFGLLDILALKLNSSLVVLSACETSRGRLLPGEGVLGPAQAFLQAGASTVLASYWRVDDAATSAFMQRFYKYLLLEHLPASVALHKAQLDRAAASPSYDWAAFALYGWLDSSI